MMKMVRAGAISKVAILLMLSLALVLGCKGKKGSDGDEGAVGPEGPAGEDANVTVVADNGRSVEACTGCHGTGGVAPVGDITDTEDVHYIDTDADGPETASGYRQLAVTITEVDVSGTSIVIEFEVEDEDGAPVTDIFAGDGRFTIATLQPGADPGDASFWQSLINDEEDPGAVGNGPGTPELQADSERFTSGAGVFETEDTPGSGLGAGEYRYTSAFDPSDPAGEDDIAIEDGETYRLAIQLSAGDIPAGNGWCDFIGDEDDPSACTGGAITREIVETATCNRCHGATSDVQLAIHGGGRTQVEYCVTCHNPGSTDANSGNSVNLTEMIHKIHAGASLENDYMIYGFRNSLHDYSSVNFTAELDNCTFCHNGGGAEVDNWKEVPTRAACGSCHDDVNFETGDGHGGGGRQTNDGLCNVCHPATTANPSLRGIQDVHKGEARNAEAALYTGGANGFLIEDVTWDADADELTIEYSVTRDGVKMDLDAAEEWRDLRSLGGGGASRLQISVAWNALDYFNEGSGSAPAQPLGLNAAAADASSTAVNIGGNVFQVVAELPSDANGTVTVTLDGHPAADLDGDTTYTDRIPVRNAFFDVDVDLRGMGAVARRLVVDVDLCNKCHDSGGVGVSLHGNNRTGEPQVCVVCHNPDATDIERRPDPGPGVDGKNEETIDFKRMIHLIHTGAELEDGVVIYGFGSSVNDFSNVEFIGNRMNCETCHFPGTYGTEEAHAALATTIDTGDDEEDPLDDLNISPVASVCSGCHSDATAKGHMIEQGASFEALDEDIQ